jgi:predicted TIM-barrel fold metal-dependent hydrolase
MPKRRLAATLLTALLSAAAWAENTVPPPMIDAHAHYAQPDADALSPNAILATLDAAGVRRMAVTGAPPELAQTLYRHAPDRVLPVLSVYTEDAHKSNWVHDAALPARVAAALENGRWAALGELHLFAADARAPVFEALVKCAAAHDLVLLLHGDAEIVSRAFEIAPNLRVLWAHLGTDPHPEALEPMLTRHPKLWIDTSVRDERIAPDGRLLPEWRALFERHPDRFVVAVDSFSTNRWRRYGEVVEAIRAWTAGLPPALRDRLLHDNAARLFEAFPAPPARP